MAKNEEGIIEETPLKSVTLEYNGSIYTLEFNRRTAAMVERQYGFSMNELTSGKISFLPDLFRCALVMHHPKMKQETADMLFDLMDDKQGLMICLVELYANAINSLMESPEEGKGISWTRH